MGREREEYVERCFEGEGACEVVRQKCRGVRMVPATVPDGFVDVLKSVLEGLVYKLL